MIERLAEDHANARRLGDGLAELPGIVAAGDIAQPDEGPFDPDRVATNFVLFRVTRSRAAFLAALRARNVLMVEYPHGQVRAVTHLRDQPGRHRHDPRRRRRRPARDDRRGRGDALTTGCRTGRPGGLR